MHSNINTLTFRKTVRVFHGLQVTVLSALVNGVKDYVIIMSFLPPAVYCDRKRLGVKRSHFDIINTYPICGKTTRIEVVY